MSIENMGWEHNKTIEVFGSWRSHTQDVITAISHSKKSMCHNLPINKCFQKHHKEVKIFMNRSHIQTEEKNFLKNFEK